MGKTGDELRRRDFMRGAIAAGAAFTILGATAKGAGRALKVGLIGCGGRGRGALKQHLDAAKILNDTLSLGLDVKATATADWFRDRAGAAGTPFDVPEDHCFGGADAYRKLIDSGVDIVLMATAPLFRPVHFEAAVKAGKHVFFEKPVAVDPPGCRRVLEAGKLAESKNLVIVAGTNMRHEKGFINTHQALAVEGAFGKLRTGRISFCMAHMFFRKPIQPKTADDLVRSWQNWITLSGDHLVEQHVHNIDIANWFAGRPPVSAAGFGGRARRPAGDMFDFFSIDYDYGGVHIHSMCRQVNGCWNWTGHDLVYDGGRTSGSDGPAPKQSPIPADLPCERSGKPIEGHLQEHINLLYHLAKEKPLNQAQPVTEATAAAVMGRISAYTGEMVKWDEMMADPKKNPELYNLTLKPTAEDFEKGEVEIPEENVVPVPGKDVGGRRRPAPKKKRGKKA